MQLTMGQPMFSLGDAVVGQDLALTLGGGAAVAAHGGHDEELSALGLDKVHHGSHDGIVVDDHGCRR